MFILTLLALRMGEDMIDRRIDIFVFKHNRKSDIRRGIHFPLSWNPVVGGGTEDMYLINLICQNHEGLPFPGLKTSRPYQPSQRKTWRYMRRMVPSITGAAHTLSLSLTHHTITITLPTTRPVTPPYHISQVQRE